MRFLVLFIFFAQGLAAQPSAQIGWHFYTGVSAFLGGSSYDCTNNGSVGFTTQSGFQCATFDNTATKYFGGSAALTTFINANKARMQVEVHVKKITNVGVDGIWYWSYNSGACSGDLSLYSSTAAPLIQDPDAAACVGGGNVGNLGTAVWHSLIYSTSGGFDYFYMDGIQVGSAVATGAHGTVDVAAEIGRYGAAFPGDEYLRDLIISNGDVCTGPSCADYAAASGIRNPYLEKITSPDLGARIPLWMRLFSPSKLYAITQNQMLESKYNMLIKTAYDTKLATIKFQDAVVSGKGSPTKTPTVSPTPDSKAAVLTATPTPTPSK